MNLQVPIPTYSVIFMCDSLRAVMFETAGQDLGQSMLVRNRDLLKGNAIVATGRRYPTATGRGIARYRSRVGVRGAVTMTIITEIWRTSVAATEVRITGTGVAIEVTGVVKEASGVATEATIEILTTGTGCVNTTTTISAGVGRS